MQGIPVSVAESYQYAVKVIRDGFGGLIFAWEDYRPDESSSDIYCQRLSGSGLWGNPEPGILSCADVPADQGGWVRITTAASPLDAAGEEIPIFGYNVWRLIGGAGPLAASAGAASMDARSLALLSDPATAIGVRVSGPQAAALGLPEGDWESVGFWFATRDTIYHIAVPTRNDSTESGTAEETYIVTAHTSTAGVFVASAPAVGYSVDNLAPGMTAGLRGERDVPLRRGSRSPGSRTPPPISGRYDIYRGEDAIFVPDGRILSERRRRRILRRDVGEGVSVSLQAHRGGPARQKGPAALLRPEDIKVGTMLQSFAAALKQSAIELTWTLAELDETAALKVLRSSGGSFEDMPSIEIERAGLAFTVVDRSVEPGTTYRYRLDVAQGAGSRTLFMTDGITTPSMPLDAAPEPSESVQPGDDDRLLPAGVERGDAGDLRLVGAPRLEAGERSERGTGHARGGVERRRHERTRRELRRVLLSFDLREGDDLEEDAPA